MPKRWHSDRGSQNTCRGLRDLGVTHVWLTGCLRQATLTAYPALGLEADDPDVVKGRAGSFYAVRDYFDVCPDYAVDGASRMKSSYWRLQCAGPGRWRSCCL